MKSHIQMNEGAAAFDKFRTAMKAIVVVPKTTILEADKKAKKRRKSRKMSSAKAGYDL
jgi:hypothetical protein